MRAWACATRSNSARCWGWRDGGTTGDGPAPPHLRRDPATRARLGLMPSIKPGGRMDTRDRRRVAAKGWKAIWPLAACAGLAVVIVACSDSAGPEPADTVFRSGYVYTVDDH